LRKIYSGKGKFCRRRSVDNFIQEIKEVKKKYPLKRVIFYDDTFNLNDKWLMKFLDKYSTQIKIPFECNIRADLITERQAQALKSAGCYQITFGIETGNEQIRERLLKKRLKNKQIIRASKLLHKHKINFSTFNMISLPGETIEQAFETIKLNILIRTPVTYCSILQAYPKTEIAEYIQKRGFLDSYTPDMIPPAFYNYSLIKSKESRELINLHRFFITAVKFPFLIPLIKKLIRLPPNTIFDLIFLVSHLYMRKKDSNKGFRQLIKSGFRHVGLFLKNKRN
jgi:radical SAM superfamily enzyme YgiQ (UPF0313 family)